MGSAALGPSHWQTDCCCNRYREAVRDSSKFLGQACLYGVVLFPEFPHGHVELLADLLAAKCRRQRRVLAVLDPILMIEAGERASRTLTACCCV
jgi:hypothetical protein